MKEMLSETVRTLEKGIPAVLCLVIATEGSSPRKAGSKMLVPREGTPVGTVGGGAAEWETVRAAREIMTDGQCTVRRFLLHPEETANTGMVCGGEITVLFLPFAPRDCNALKELLSGNQDRVIIRTAGSAGEAVRGCSGEEPDFPRELFRTVPVYLPDRGLYSEPMTGKQRAFLYGGGHLCAALVPVLAGLDFAVTVTDDRPEMTGADRFPGAERVACVSFDAIPEEYLPGKQDYAVVMTKGHGCDFEVLRQVLPRKVRYLGCIGSSKKAALVRQRLLDAGFDEALTDGIHSPVGLKIGAETPEEIAISIAAEMILCRAKALGVTHGL